MADPFYSNKWNPFHHVYYPQAAIQPRSTKPKTVSIPVNFVGSDGGASKQSPAPDASSTLPQRVSRTVAAVAIQKAARGFLVRKNVRLVRQVESEADAIERRVEEDDRVRRNPIERLRASEELMALLLRLDSVRGVRDYRKKVIGRVIGLQEAIDSISDASDCDISTTPVPDPEYPACQAHEQSSPIVHGNQTLDPQLTEQSEAEMEIEIQAEVVSPKGTADSIMIANNRITAGQDESKSMAEGKSSGLEVEMDDAETGLEKEVRAAVELPKRESDILGNENEQDGTGESEENSEDDKVEETMVMAETSEEGRGLRKMMEKMAAENESLKLMVARLCETSAEQCRLMEGLADRISHLERLTHGRDRRKKRRNGSSCAAPK